MGKPTLSPAAQAEILAIAVQHLRIETLDRRWRDSLDFYEVAVWCVRDALEAAYLAGMVEHHRSRR
ncbi:DUF6900 domain-containing protein [Achromobacter ruhlandii]|uniref:DUF6900 domain-containing protein n=1 Tax=Achromobacter ruhlandii TaxID=72557 RepID=UPI003BA0DCF6